MAEPFIALIAATAILAAIPGPNVAFIVAGSLERGFRHGAVIVAGTTLGVAAQLALVVLGLAAVLTVAAEAMVWIKWLGVIYLIGLGVRAWRRHTDDTPLPARAASAFWHGVAVATVNPKTLMFNAAFLPQFVPSGSTPADLALFALVYLAVLWTVDMMWAAFAWRARTFLSRFNGLRHKLTGGFLFGAGIGLALARIQR